MRLLLTLARCRAGVSSRPPAPQLSAARISNTPLPTLVRWLPSTRAASSAALERSPDEEHHPPFEPLSRRSRNPRQQTEFDDEGSEASDIRGSSSSTSGSGSSSSSGGDRTGMASLRPPTEPGPELTLALPANLRMGYYSSYPELTRLISRVPVLRAMHTAEQCPEELTRLRIGPLLGAGRTWTVYGASAGPSRMLSSFGQDPSAPGEPTMERRSVGDGGPYSSAAPLAAAASAFPPLVVKLFSPDIGPFPRATDGSASASSSSSSSKAAEARANMRAALSEAEMYAGPLRALQGTAVPRYFGLYSGADDEGRWLYALVLERVGRAIHRRRDGGKGTWETLIPQQRRAIAQLYAQIHGAGVVHGDMELRHIRRELGDKSDGGKGGLRLIDFEGARLRPEGVDGERAELDRCIGPDWRRWLGVVE